MVLSCRILLGRMGKSSTGKMSSATGQRNLTLATVQTLIRYCDSINRSVWQLEVVTVEEKMEQNLKG